jgi:hypothetical protein
MWRRGIDNLGSQDVLGDWDLFIFYRRVLLWNN